MNLGLSWKIFSGIKKSTKQPAAVFVLEKRSLEAKYPGSERRFERERLLEQFKKSISQLTRLRHPQILTVQFPLEESRDCLAFATEPVFASLANLLGRHDNLPSPVPPQVRDYKMFDVEIKYGLLQVWFSALSSKCENSRLGTNKLSFIFWLSKSNQFRHLTGEMA